MTDIEIAESVQPREIKDVAKGINNIENWSWLLFYVKWTRGRRKKREH